MRRRREYQKATEFDLDAIVVNLHGISDPSSGNEARSLEVIDLAIQMFELASKRGRVRTHEEEVFDEAA